MNFQGICLKKVGRKFHQDVVKRLIPSKNYRLYCEPKFWQPQKFIYIYITLDTNSPFLEKDEKRRVGDRVSLTNGWHEASGTSSSSGSCASLLSTKFCQGIRQTWTLRDPPQNRMSISTSQHDFLSKRLLVVFLSHHFSIKQLSKNKIHLSLPPFSPRVSRWESENQPTKQNLHLHHSSRNESTTGPHHRCEESLGQDIQLELFLPPGSSVLLVSNRLKVSWRRGDSQRCSQAYTQGAKSGTYININLLYKTLHLWLPLLVQKHVGVRLHLPSGGFHGLNKKKRWNRSQASFKRLILSRKKTRPCSKQKWVWCFGQKKIAGEFCWDPNSLGPKHPTEISNQKV